MLKFLEKVKSSKIFAFSFLPKVIYSKAVIQINSIKTVNKGQKYHSAQYKQGFNFDQVSKFMLGNLNTKIGSNPLQKILNSLLESYRAGKQVYWFGEMNLHPQTFNLSESAQKSFGKYFEPELLKYFNICGEILQNQRRWWRSGLLFTDRNQNVSRIFEQQTKECS